MYIGFLVIDCKEGYFSTVCTFSHSRPQFISAKTAFYHCTFFVHHCTFCASLHVKTSPAPHDPYPKIWGIVNPNPLKINTYALPWTLSVCRRPDEVILLDNWVSRQLRSTLESGCADNGWPFANLTFTPRNIRACSTSGSYTDRFAVGPTTYSPPYGAVLYV